MESPYWYFFWFNAVNDDFICCKLTGKSIRTRLIVLKGMLIKVKDLYKRGMKPVLL